MPSPRIMTRRPHDAPVLPFAAGLIIYPDDGAAEFWAANAWVSNAVSATAHEHGTELAKWVCETLNARVIQEARS